MPTFEQIQEEIALILDIPETEMGEEDSRKIDDYLDMLAGQEAAKVDSFAQFIRLESEKAKACKEEAKRLADRARNAQGRIDYLKEKYLAIMQQRGLKKIAGNVYTLSVRRSERVAITENQEELAKLYAELGEVYINRKVEYKPDKAAIREGLKGGLDIPGCGLAESFSLVAR